MSKASKEVNLSEDVFAGYKTVLRGGRVVFREYHQVRERRALTPPRTCPFCTHYVPAGERNACRDPNVAPSHQSPNPAARWARGA